MSQGRDNAIYAEAHKDGLNAGWATPLVHSPRSFAYDTRENEIAEAGWREGLAHRKEYQAARAAEVAEKEDVPEYTNSSDEEIRYIGDDGEFTEEGVARLIELINAVGEEQRIERECRSDLGTTATTSTTPKVPERDPVEALYDRVYAMTPEELEEAWLSEDKTLAKAVAYRRVLQRDNLYTLHLLKNNVGLGYAVRLRLKELEPEMGEMIRFVEKMRFTYWHCMQNQDPDYSQLRKEMAKAKAKREELARINQVTDMEELLRIYSEGGEHSFEAYERYCKVADQKRSFENFLVGLFKSMFGK